MKFFEEALMKILLIKRHIPILYCLIFIILCFNVNSCMKIRSLKSSLEINGDIASGARDMIYEHTYNNWKPPKPQ